MTTKIRLGWDTIEVAIDDIVSQMCRSQWRPFPGCS